MAESSVKNREVEYISNPCLVSDEEHDYGLLTSPNSRIHVAKYGKIIMIMCDGGEQITVKNAGWKNIATLVSDIRPSNSYNPIYVAGFDENANTQASSTVLSIRIRTNGNIEIYFFSDKLTLRPKFSIAYPIA